MSQPFSDADLIYLGGREESFEEAGTTQGRGSPSSTG